MKKKAIVFLLISIFILSSCNDSDISEPNVPQLPKPSPIPELEFTCIKYIPESGEGIEFSSDHSMDENYLIYYRNDGNRVFYGFMDLQFNKLTEPVYLFKPFFNEGLAFTPVQDTVTNEVMAKIVDRDLIQLDVDPNLPFMYEGKWLSVEYITMRYRSVGAYGERLNNWHKIITDSQYGNSDNILDMLVPVRSNNGLYGYKSFEDVVISKVNEDEGYKIPPIYKVANFFSEGLAVVKLDNDFGYIDSSGNLMIDYQFSQANEFSKGLARVAENTDELGYNTNLWFLIDKDGNRVTENKYTVIENFQDGFAFANLPNLENGGLLLDESGKEHYRGKFLGNLGFKENVALVWTSTAEYYFMDRDGYNINGREYDYAHEFNDGLALVRVKDLYGYIGKDGTILIDPIYEYATDFNSGFAVVRLPDESLSFVIDKNQNKYLEELNLSALSAFNEDGYALGYSEVDSEGNKIYYVVHLLN